MKKERLIEILNNFDKAKIAVVGDMMLDDYIIGSVDRISPEAPVPIVKVLEEKFVLGGATNVVNNLATLGTKTFPFGVIGDDANGDRLVNALKEKKVDCDGIVRAKDRPTILKRRIIGGHQQLLRIDWENNSPISENYENILIENIRKNIKNLDGIILSDYDKGILTKKVSTEIIKIANENNVIVTVDPKPKNATNYKNATCMTPNKKEAMECLGVSKIENIHEFGRELKEKLSLKNLLLTRSEEGMSIFSEEFEKGFEDIPTYAKDVFDVTGAGDTVISVFTLALVSGASLFEAAKISNTAAGIVVGRVGTSTVSKEEIIKFYDEIYHEWK
ncbi:MAG: D-glycero-beta-D-manno-heptose-7-phosphate kinase [Fusobacteriaceae bacterium]